MPNSFKPIDLSQVKTYSLSKRKSQVSAKDFAKAWRKGLRYKDFLDSLPDILAGKHIKRVIASITTAVKHNKTVVFAMGAHVIKVGLSPIVIDLMERRVITAVAMNGAGIIHDLELAMVGQTSEDVDAAIDNGSFGMADETCSMLSQAVALADNQSIGLGDAVGRMITEKALTHPNQSILAAGTRLGIPVTVHVAIGTDIIHMHPGFDARGTGEATHKDFRKFSAVVASLEEGVFLNVGSAVIMPEVFLKALTLVRNLGYDIKHFTTVNMDFIRQYRPSTNVVKRPTLKGGQGFDLTGHHEIMLPLIAAGIIEQIS